MMDAQILPFRPRPRVATDPTPATPGDVVPLDPDPPFTIGEIARYLRMSDREARELIHIYGMPGVKVGGRWQIPRRQFRAWFDSTREDYSDEGGVR
jgi:excisionase family DNA binding protein